MQSLKNLEIPQELYHALINVEQIAGDSLYVSGGTVRDILLGKPPCDLDITVAKGARKCCRKLLDILSEGAFVPLGTDVEEAARIVWRDHTVDISSFRKQAQTIEEDLSKRDFTINAMALPLNAAGQDHLLLDPLGGVKDLQDKRLHHCPDAFEDDPLRLLRGFRFMAELGFTLSVNTLEEIVGCSHLLHRSAPERVQYELDRIMSTTRSSQTIELMARTGLLWQVIPELKDGVGVEQPGFHHKDVFGHSLLALESVEAIMTEPERYFNEGASDIRDYLEKPQKRKLLRWACLFHDLGKPSTCSSSTIDSERVTFYNHDQVGQEIFDGIARRLRWSNDEREWVGALINMHMHPFHLAGVKRKKEVTRKACLKIYKRAEEDLAGLFVLAMADSLAGQGELKPEDMEDILAELFDEVLENSKKHIRPKLEKGRFITGHDLVSYFNLKPGPQFRLILDELEVAVVEDKVQNKEEALKWVDEYLQENLEYPRG